MPELPEVETVLRGLVPVMQGHVIANADIRRSGLRWPFPEHMRERLVGQPVVGMHRRSKYILVDLASGETLIVHLGMTGRMTIHLPKQAVKPGRFHQSLPNLEKHDHVVLEMETGARVVFNDARRFGAMDLVATTTASQHRLLAQLGPEPLGNSFDQPYLVAALKGRNTPIKSALLDQKLVAGLGNIYVCEALWRAHVLPTRRAFQLSATNAGSLVPVIRDVLTEAIAAGGSSLKDYRRTDGELGYFQHSFAAYGREGEPCQTPGCDGQISRIRQSGRSTFFCRTCQR
ncbi:MAG: bifunctional DNA-formamidopyrimidine glycosylase/DNA-(apurinic or apyrimidinic site) lyase [Rhodobacteraceae bacterium]|nr:bifunctional DNA-formamidopyrimidine glycosylase/DNA-(apurinic or apyrimidinic site) lyase [Paracoccaceae bacterium]